MGKKYARLYVVIKKAKSFCCMHIFVAICKAEKNLCLSKKLVFSFFKNFLLDFLIHVVYRWSKPAKKSSKFYMKLCMQLLLIPNFSRFEWWFSSTNPTILKKIPWVPGTIFSLTNYFFHDFLEKSLQKLFQFIFL